MDDRDFALTNNFSCATINGIVSRRWDNPVLDGYSDLSSVDEVTAAGISDVWLLAADGSHLLFASGTGLIKKLFASAVGAALSGVFTLKGYKLKEGSPEKILDHLMEYSEDPINPDMELQ
ncbi:Protein of unknown function [Gryllus bimaculatus]|nr:Protein of unknown function [Gryllus bimaculatus]